VKVVLSLAVLLTSALWADEVADRVAIEATIAALNATPERPDIFTADFPNAAEFRRFKDENRLHATVVISREPMGEATWSPGAIAPFVTRSVTFITQDTAVVVGSCQQQLVVFVMKHKNSTWRIASFRSLPEAQTKVL
jgi:hypothetical protein